MQANNQNTTPNNSQAPAASPSTPSTNTSGASGSASSGSTGNSHYNSSNNTHHNSSNNRGPRHYNNNHYGGHGHHNSHHNNQHQQGGAGYPSNYGWAASQQYVAGYPAPGAYGAQAYGYYTPQNYYPQMVQHGYIHPTSAPQPHAQAPIPMASPPTATSPSMTNSVPYTPAQHHKISIKNHNGETVTFAKAHTKSPSISSTVSTSPVVAAGKLASPVLNKASATVSEAAKSPAPAPATIASSPAPVAKTSAALDFMAKIKAKAAAAAKKEAEEAKETKKEEKEEKTPAEEASTPVEEQKKEEEKPKEATPVEESKPVTKEETKPAVTESVPVVEKKESVEEPKQAAESKEVESTTQPKAEIESKETTTESIKDSKDVEASGNDTEDVEAETSDKETNDGTLDVETISTIFDRINASKNIDDYSTFKYPDTISPSVLRSKPHKKIRYEPPFLLQFADKLRFPTDERWGSTVAAKILIPTAATSGSRKEGKGDRSGSQGGFGKSFGSKGPYAAGVNNLRGGQNQRDLGSRNGSRGGSKRGLGGRERSKKDRNNSKKGSSGRGNEQEGEDAEEKPAPPPVEVKPLEKSANRWVPRSLRKAEKPKIFAPDGVTELLDEEDVSAKTKSLLNKLTLDNMETISSEIIAIANQSKFENDGKTLQQVIELIFAKACDEIHWSQVYAQLCIILVKTISPEIKVDDRPTPEDPEQAQHVASMLVRKFLIVRCQTEYEKGWMNKLTDENGEVKEVELMSDEYYAQAAAKRRGLGLARFIAELFVLGLIGEKIIINCLKDLTQTKAPTEADTETLDKLLRTAGKKLEGTAQGQMALNYSFNVISGWSENEELPYKVRFKLMDLIDLKKSQWSLGSEDKGPKTIAEIHEAERKKLEDQSKQRNNNSGRRGGESRQNSSRGNSKWGNESVSSSDLSNMGQIRNSSDRSLGPMSNFSKSKSVRQQIKEKGSPQSFTQLNNASNNTNSNSTQGSQTSLATNSSRELSKRSESTRQNMFLHLDDEEEQESSEEEKAEGEVEVEGEAEIEGEGEVEAEAEAEAEVEGEGEAEAESESTPAAAGAEESVDAAEKTEEVTAEEEQKTEESIDTPTDN